MMKRALAIAALYSAILFAGSIVAAPVYAQVSSGKVTTAAPTYPNNTAQPLSLDTSGGLRVNCATGCGVAPVLQDVNLTQVGGAAIALGQAASAASIPVVLASDQSAIPVEGLGTAGVPTGGILTIQGMPSMEPLDVNVISGGGGGSPFNAPFPTDGVAAGYEDDVSGDMVPGVYDNATDGIQVTCVSGCGGSGGTSSTFGNAFPTDGTAIGLIDPSGDMAGGEVDASGNLHVNLQTALPAGANAIGSVTIGAALPAGNNNIGDVDVASIAAGNNNIGDVDVASISAGVNTIGSVAADPGASNYSLIAASGSNATNVKASAGTVFDIQVSNNSATIAYLKLYNSASAPTCGSGTPVARYLVPASTAGAGSNVSFPVGKTFSSGIGFCLTTGIADADTGSVAATTYLINITYK
jgi:hypothetical protein